MKKNTVIKFLEKRNLWFFVSFVFVAIGFLLMGMRAFESKPILNYGIDFSGGSTMMLKLDDLTNALAAAKTTPEKNKISAHYSQEVRNALSELKLESSSIQITDTGEVIIKTVEIKSDMQNQVKDKIQQKIGKFELLELDFIGPTIGAELRQRAIWITLLVSLALMGYVTFRFQLNFGIATLAATLHDALILLSFASIFYMEINIEFIAVIFTILGYSMNDTVVIFDRIRENLQHVGVGESLMHTVNNALTQTLTRTLFTVLTTLIVTSSLLIFGGQMIREFSLLLFIGILVGTYSSLAIASPVYYLLAKRQVPPS